jgi:prevent-host-death family protein
MATVSIKEARDRFTELARLAERGEEVVITRNGKPALQLVPYRSKGGVDLQAGDDFLRQHGVTQLFSYIAEDFDEPLPEDFLLRPLP